MRWAVELVMWVSVEREVRVQWTGILLPPSHGLRLVIFRAGFWGLVWNADYGCRGCVVVVVTLGMVECGVMDLSFFYRLVLVA